MNKIMYDLKLQKIPLIIKYTREQFHETQSGFGERFGVSNMAVSYWEQGLRKAPYEVIEFCLNYANKIKTCDKCDGKGYIEIAEENKGV